MLIKASGISLSYHQEADSLISAGPESKSVVSRHDRGDLKDGPCRPDPRQDHELGHLASFDLHAPLADYGLAVPVLPSEHGQELCKTLPILFLLRLCPGAEPGPILNPLVALTHHDSAASTIDGVPVTSIAQVWIRNCHFTLQLVTRSTTLSRAFRPCSE